MLLKNRWTDLRLYNNKQTRGTPAGKKKTLSVFYVGSQSMLKFGLELKRAVFKTLYKGKDTSQ